MDITILLQFFFGNFESSAITYYTQDQSLEPDVSLRMESATCYIETENP